MNYLFVYSFSICCPSSCLNHILGLLWFIVHNIDVREERRVSLLLFVFNKRSTLSFIVETIVYSARADLYYHIIYLCDAFVSRRQRLIHVWLQTQ